MLIDHAIKTLVAVFITVFTVIGCTSNNHIDTHKVSIDSLKTLPDYFYAHRRGRVYLEDINAENYRIWFNKDNEGNVKDIFKIEDLKRGNSNSDFVTKTYSIDTSLCKIYTQKFIDLSRKYKIGHIFIDRNNKIYFSYKDGLAEEYVKVLNDSINNVYSNKKDFVLLSNGWYQNTEQ